MPPYLGAYVASVCMRRFDQTCNPYELYESYELDEYYEFYEFEKGYYYKYEVSRTT